MRLLAKMSRAVVVKSEAGTSVVLTNVPSDPQRPIN